MPPVGTKYAHLILLMETVSRKEIILYAEDDLDDFEALDDATRQVTNHYELVQAKNGLEVIAYLQNHPDEQPSVIVLDLNMPQMDGKETLQWLKQQDQYRDIPILVFTTSSREEDMRLCKSYNCSFFRKPTLYRDLLHIVQVIQKMAEENKHSNSFQH